MDEIFQIAKQLGVDEKEAHKLVTLNKVLSNRIITTILWFIIGVIVGAFFPEVRTITKYTYPYLSIEVVSGIGTTRVSKKSFIPLTIILGIIGFMFGFMLSSRLIFARTFIEYEHPPIQYGVFARKPIKYCGSSRCQ